MTPVNVLVIFESRSGRTEKLALAAAVGAVQARASIRIRRVNDDNWVEHPNEILARMQREYVPPTRTDAVWADAVIIGVGGKLCGISLEPDGATAYGRQVATDVRAGKRLLS